MKARFLFPYYFKFIGIGLFLAHVLVVLLWHVDYHSDEVGVFTPAHLFFLSTLLLMVIGLLMIAFSKERVEDEQIAQLRLDSLQWAVYVNYILIIITLVFTTGWEINHILQVNFWGPLIFFIVRFRWMMYRLNRLPKEGVH